MQTITTIGLDIAKSVFQVHGVDNDGKVVIRRQLKRRYVLAFFEKLPQHTSPQCGSKERQSRLNNSNAMKAVHAALATRPTGMVATTSTSRTITSQETRGRTRKDATESLAPV